MTDIIKHQGIVENVNGSHLSVRIIQTSACASCSAKGHCTSADSQEKQIDVVDTHASYRVGDRVMLVGEMSIGIWAVLFAFVIPFVLLIVSLFAAMAWLNDELCASLAALIALVPYYCVLRLCKNRLKKKLSFTLTSINN